VPEQVLLLLTQDNVDIACQVIEKVAMDRAVIEIDEALAQAYDIRHRHLEVSLCDFVCRGFLMNC
jgi:CCR4-NOT transcription complex subunit 1